MNITQELKSFAEQMLANAPIIIRILDSELIDRTIK